MLYVVVCGLGACVLVVGMVYVFVSGDGDDDNDDVTFRVLKVSASMLLCGCSM